MSTQGKITFWVAVLMSINIIVGGGIFSGPQSMAAVTGSWSFIAWFLAAALVFPVVWGIAQASRLFPGSGGFYNYCAKGINKDFGFIAQWIYLLGYSLGTCAAMTTLLRNGLAEKIGLEMVATHPLLFNAIIIGFFSFLNLLPIEIISRIQGSVTLLKLIPLFIVIATFAWYINPSMPYLTSDFLNLGLTIPTVIFGYLGFEACCSLGHMLEDGPESVGKVILTAFFITALLYMLFNFGLLQIMGVENLAAYGPMAFAQYLGLSEGLATILSLSIVGSILLSYANSVFGVALSNVTNIAALADNNLIGGKALLTRTNKIGRPTVAALVHGIFVWAFLCFITDVNTLFSFTVMGVGAAYFLTVVAVMLTNLKRKNYQQVGLMALAFASCAVLFYCCWIGLGQGIIDRVINLSPLIIGTIIGFILYKLQTARA